VPPARSQSTTTAHQPLHPSPAPALLAHTTSRAAPPRPDREQPPYSSRPVAGSASVDNGGVGTAAGSGNGGGVPPYAGHSA
jgi:hypothetical protein